MKKTLLISLLLGFLPTAFAGNDESRALNLGLKLKDPKSATAAFALAYIKEKRDYFASRGKLKSPADLEPVIVEVRNCNVVDYSPSPRCEIISNIVVEARIYRTCPFKFRYEADYADRIVQRTDYAYPFDLLENEPRPRQPGDWYTLAPFEAHGVEDPIGFDEEGLGCVTLEEM